MTKEENPMLTITPEALAVMRRTTAHPRKAPAPTLRLGPDAARRIDGGELDVVADSDGRVRFIVRDGT